MIRLNMTLIFQICHFLIAYFLLTRFLWKPVIAHIDQQEAHKNNLEEDLFQQEQIVEQKIFALDRMWQNAQSSFQVHTPELIRSGAVRKEEEYKIIEPKISPEMIKTLTNEIVKKVQE
ncbi:TPA: hypothetical protein DIC20_01615 [Candidatus Dependentiae bacterium]|nr:MAG: hypothetical protein US03_C0008G0012 [candidate division TM6 bacterium GW2011_GWF2_36_131]KKQ02953.1 MAG: hypothetical protein US13_C0008G0026 [candidate division TM6 bacterium GW2011_GWE2_36_25]KKQ19678.1 MAG: hypothetical protein US32_C0006G0012 [candidate division TM6 bacterium GW2011_GWA2_36_9]HBR70940.1 hypothetical protein [Candidatus Dependentiae bacterium]HCU00383.1 hypothetical protein [Candidatus Dependentiae bacterium]